MVSSSTSSSKSFKYEVFLSFRGEDTRNNFVAHLHSALKRQSIHTFKDDENMMRGERISGELIKAIEASRLYIIVFSRNYASSSWCLDELVKIMEFQKTTDHTAYPVFYDVEPTEVRKQIGAVGEAFTKRRMDEDAGKWIEALKEAADLAGFTLKGDEAKFIDEIVEKISLELPSINFSDIEKFIGMEGRVKDIVSSLKTGSKEVRMIGIKGMGGGGKTTLAKAVFDQISHQFKHKSFVADVREKVSKDPSGLESLQKQVLSDVLKDEKIKVTSVTHGKLQMKKKMGDKEVLLVLDDVDDIEQLKALAEPNCFTKGSIIIITTRDEGVLIAHGMNSKSIHGVSLLSDEEAICLFSWHAFGMEIPIPDEYKELSRQVVLYAAGLPLTIRVLGLDLKGKDEDEWKETLEELETIPLVETIKQLELSYMGLLPRHKDIFLDVACFLKGKEKDEAIIALESCQLKAKAGLRVLERKSLITVSENGLLGMHDSIQEMGRDIVRRHHPNQPYRHSRLWMDEEIENILANDLGTEAIRGIRYSSTRINSLCIMEGFKNMKNLQYLELSTPFAAYSYRDYNEVSQYYPNALQYLSLTCHPFSYLPITTSLSNNLVGLYMCHSNLVQLWKEGERKVLEKLRFLHIMNFTNLKTLDLWFTPKLEKLSIRDCPFMKLHLGRVPNLETLSLQYCDHLVELHMPTQCLKLKSLDINDSKLATLYLGRAPNLETLSLQYCDHLVELHMPTKCLKLKSLDIWFSKLTTLDLRGASNLETLSLQYCDHLVELHMPTECLKLKSLDMCYSKLTTLDLRRAPNLETLNLPYFGHLVKIHMPTECLKLKSLNINGLKLTTLDLGGAQNLETLSLGSCDHLVQLQMPAECLKLKFFRIKGSTLTTLNLGGTPNLKEFSLINCVDLLELHMPVEILKLEFFQICGSKLTTLDLRQTSNLNPSSVEVMVDLVKRDIKIKGSKLRTLDLKSPWNLETFSRGCYDLIAHNMDGGGQKLRTLNLIDSNSRFITFLLEKIRMSPQWTGMHTLDGIVREVLKDLYQLQHLKELALLSMDFKHLSNCICGFRHLKYLKLESCSLLETIIEDLGRLECLEKLILSECRFLRDIPNSICKMKRLQYISLCNCFRVEKLPEELGHLECLEELNIEGTCIRNLPQSIIVLKHRPIFGPRSLRIVWSRLHFELCGFTSEIQTSEDETFCYI